MSGELLGRSKGVRNLYLASLQNGYIELSKLRYFDHDSCPIHYYDGIFYPDDTVDLLDVDTNWRKGGSARFRESTTLDELDILGWNTVGCTGKSSYYGYQAKYGYDIDICWGGDTYGSDGFVALTQHGTQELIWMLMSFRSNPFLMACLDGDQVILYSSLHVVWEIPIAQPRNISIYGTANCSG